MKILKKNKSKGIKVNKNISTSKKYCFINDMIESMDGKFNSVMFKIHYDINLLLFYANIDIYEELKEDELLLDKYEEYLDIIQNIKKKIDKKDLILLNELLEKQVDFNFSYKNLISKVLKFTEIGNVKEIVKDLKDLDFSNIEKVNKIKEFVNKPTSVKK